VERSKRLDRSIYKRSLQVVIDQGVQDAKQIIPSSVSSSVYYLTLTHRV